MPRPKLGFEFRETMTGSYTLAPGQAAAAAGERPARVTLHAVAESALQHLKDGLTRAEGVLELAGFADESACAGTLEIALLGKRIIRYDLGFVAGDGQAYRLVGQKDIRLGDLAGSMTTLPFEIVGPGGKVAGRGTLRFDLAGDWLPFATSWRPVLGRA